tara:strand:+ start:5768 stop:6781 length:1014 start_codon:yes stop_codon:yes gene_type:complete
MKILITGGCGYIGSHTIINLITNGFEVVSIDNFSNSYASVLDGIESITGVKVKNYAVDLCDLKATQAIFTQENEIGGVIHFAALKYVDESVQKPLKYYTNNLVSLSNVLECCKEFNILNFVFSSSCSVYGNAENLPVDENCPLAKAESPYAQTKVIGEQIVQDYVAAYGGKASLLRYFNPAGAHPSGLIGEQAKRNGPNLVPRITGTLLGLHDKFIIAGNDYPTRDGTCIRDYIHVCDIAHAHTLALRWLIEQGDSNLCEVFNLGSGEGVSVLELVNAFEEATSLKINYRTGDRRPGDVIAIYADNKKAKSVLKWRVKYSLKEMMRSAWDWEKKIHQ